MVGDDGWKLEFFVLESVSVDRHAKKKNKTSLMSIHSDLTFRSIVIAPGRRFNVKDKGIGAILLAAYGVFFFQWVVI